MQRGRASASTSGKVTKGNDHFDEADTCKDRVNTTNRNISERLKGEIQTNQRAELTAVMRALEQVPDSQSVIIQTDSKYTIDCLTDWYKGWQQNGWRSRSGEAVKNQDIIKPIIKKMYEDRLREGALTDLKWVKGHSITHGNQQADALAVKGAKML